MNYSETQQITGKWIDGKPVYSVVVKHKSANVDDSNVEVADVSSFNMETIVNCFSTFNNGTYNYISPFYNSVTDYFVIYIHGGKIYCNCSSAYTYLDVTTTIMFTKTTDTAMA